MSKVFYQAANGVLRMYDHRQERASKKAPAHSPAEIHFACEALQKVADAAAYTASPDAFSIHTAVMLWRKTGERPPLFNESAE